MPLRFDSIPLERMEPDRSRYTKGLRIAIDLVPARSDSWREVSFLNVFGAVTLPGSFSENAYGGSFSDPGGSIFVATVRQAGPSSRIYEYDPSLVTFTNRTPGIDFAGAPTRWSFTKFGPTVIAAPQNNGTGAALQLQSRGSGGGNFANLVTSADRPAPKYITTAKSYVIGANNLANGGAGVYAAANPYQIMWCARNNAAVWTPGTDRAGFAPDLSDSLGELTGVAGFKDFFLAFQEFGVTRFSWIGGDGVWDAQEIAGPEFGLRAEWSPSITSTNRDTLFMANGGPAAIRNGELAESLAGPVERFFLDPRAGTNGFPLTRSGVIEACFDVYSKCWVLSAERADFFRVTPILHLPSGRYSILEGATAGVAHGVAAGRRLSSANPLEAVVFFGIDGVDLNAYRLAPTTTRETSGAELYTQRWRPATGTRAQLHSVRPLLHLEPGIVHPSEIRVTVKPFQRPDSAGTSFELTYAERDENGWLVSSKLPCEANEFEFILYIPPLGPNEVIREVPALELAFHPSSTF